MARGASGAAARGTSAVLAAAAEPGTTTVTAPVAAPAGPADEPYVFPPLFGVSTVNQVRLRPDGPGNLLRAQAPPAR